ncbi:hypothetical protein [Providencia huaxiensis]|uniref:hypothetical protein n=1 Tax=Providencia huaxiensis TaxID=2027290 RepID=UPI0034E5777F
MSLSKSDNSRYHMIYNLNFELTIMIDYIKSKKFTIPTFMFFVMAYGVFVLGIYAKNHKIPFYDLISTQVLVAIGGTSLFLIILSILYLAIYFVMAGHSFDFVFDTISYEKKANKVLYFLFSLLFSLSFFQFSLDISNFYVPAATMIIALSFLCIMFFLEKNGKEYKLFIISFALLLFNYVFFVISGFIFLFINKYYDSPAYNIFLTIIFFFSLIIPGISRDDRCSRFKPTLELEREKTEKNINKIKLSAIITMVVLFLSPVLTKVSDTVINFIGIGYEERCYYSDDLHQYKIPNTSIQQYDGVSKIFVLSDVSNKVYISKFESPLFYYSFNYESLNRIACFKSPDIEVMTLIPVVGYVLLRVSNSMVVPTDNSSVT